MPSTPLPPPVPSVVALVSPRKEVVNQLGIQGQVNKSASKTRRKLAIGDETIALALKDFSKGILEVKKMKLKLVEKIIERNREGREMMVRVEKESKEMMM